MSIPGNLKRLLAPVAIVALLIGLIGVIAWILSIRIQTGDVYAKYSSYRTDPMGTKALFLALEAMPEFRVDRNLRKFNRLHLEEPTTILCLGVAGMARKDPTFHLSKEEQKALESFLQSGHRVVITLSSESHFKEESHSTSKKTTDSPSPTPTPDEKSKEEKDVEVNQLFSGLSVIAMNQTGVGQTMKSSTFPAVVWRGSFGFEITDSQKWQVEGTVGKKPVLVSKAVGKGRLLLFSDTTFASNEGVWQARETNFIVHLIGASRVILFDEHLLGTQETPGIMTLVRRYRLHGILVGGLLLLLLLAWQGAVPLVPSDPEKDRGVDARGNTIGRDASEGLVVLLQRGIPPQELLRDCLKRWETSARTGPLPDPDSVEEARVLAETARLDQIPQMYQQMRTLLNRRKPVPNTSHGNA